jgi:hypoxanthine phosphoribosyltransferase
MSPSGKREPRLGRVLITNAELQGRVSELGQALARRYKGEHPVLVGVLQGAFVFMADLVRATPIDLVTDFMGLASYGAGTRPSGQVRLVSDLSIPVEGRHVVIVEDLIDTGLTLSYLKRNVEARHPRSVGVCVLLDKVERRQVEVEADYVGFTIPNVFVVGYGFDYAGLYRNLDHVAVLEGVDGLP